MLLGRTSISEAWSPDDLDTRIAMQQGCMARIVMIQCQRIEGPLRDCAVEVTREVCFTAWLRCAELEGLVLVLFIAG